MDGRKYKKKHLLKAQEAARSAVPSPMYHKGIRTDVPDAGMSRPKGKPPMDPRYPPAKYVKPDDFAYHGPTVVLPASGQVLMQPKPATFNPLWKNWYVWVIISAILIAVSLTIVFVALYVMGEFTEYSPVYKGYFGKK